MGPYPYLGGGAQKESGWGSWAWGKGKTCDFVKSSAGIRRECRYLPPPPLLNSSSKVNTERVDGKARRPPTSAASSSSAA
ncbi:hypothetical protein SAY86_009301 [Trapa natans]|uniref:Uncharacterized protein n=1 Tax=Trapa natans TaxID=22666 RepID=A0AAN7L480_TRANT|nr:hypothetical protein SAY86_009301 [Trapa natans]